MPSGCVETGAVQVYRLLFQPPPMANRQGQPPPMANRGLVRVHPDAGDGDDTSSVSKMRTCLSFETLDGSRSGTREKRSMCSPSAASLRRKHSRKGAKWRKDTADFDAHVRRVRHQLAEQRRDKRWVIENTSSVWMSSWDMVTSTALVYTATLTPFEVGFVPGSDGPAWNNPWFWANRTLDVIFLIDMILQFFLAFERADATGGTSQVSTHKEVVKHYLTTWFGLDFITLALPLSLDLSALGGDQSSDQSGKDPEPGKLLRVLRVLRLVKLMRLLRASRVVERWRSRVAISRSTTVIVNSLVMLTVASHWYVVPKLCCLMHRCT